jgi:hypothetical protein
MLQLMKRLFWIGLLAAVGDSAWGFSLLGPVNEAYQVPTIGYNLAGDIGAPKNLSEEYRRNTPVMFYGFDATFLDYFGSNGVYAVNQAFSIFNGLNPMSTYSADLSEVPLRAQNKNYAAQAMFLIDLKSWTMNLLIESLGLADPVRYAWTLENRFLLPGTTCPFGETYLVIQRNFDPVIGSTLSNTKPTNYVNGVFYTYQIIEFCTGPDPLAVAAPFELDGNPVATTASAVAELPGFGRNFLFSPFGFFYTGLTRDDVGGLRYLLGTNNVNLETAGANTLTFVADQSSSQLVFPSNLTTLAAQALTNNAATLGALYPNLLITASTNTFVNVQVTNVTAFFTNYPWSHAGAPAQLAFATNITFTIQQQFHHTFGNLLSIRATTNGFVSNPLYTIPPPTNTAYVTIQTIAITNSPYAPAGTTILETNISSKTYLSNEVVGEYYILPAGQCDVSILAAQLTNVTTTTNLIVIATNIPSGSTNLINQSFAQFRIDYVTNHYYVVYPVVCLANTVAARQGVDKITFVQANYDSLLGQFFTPFTNEYVLNTVTNGAIIPQRVRRTISSPDFLFTASSLPPLTPGPAGIPAVPVAERSIRFNQNNIYPGLAGPGTIDPNIAPGFGGEGALFTFNKVGPIFSNGGLIDTNAFVDQTSQLLEFQWASYDSTTNTPVIYPNDLSINNLQNQVLIQISPFVLQDGTVNAPYSVQFSVTAATSSWQAPYSWSVSPGVLPLPPGLSLSSDGVLSGSPTQSGFYDFVIRLTDSTGQTTDRNYYITINP